MAGAVMAEDAGPIMVRNCPRRSRPVDRLATCYTQVVKRPERSLPASRGWSRRMSFTHLLGCWCCSAFRGSMRLDAGDGTAGIAGLLDCFPPALISSQ
jgi:hypothetical protein